MPNQPQNTDAQKMIDTNPFYQKLADKEPLSEAEILQLLHTIKEMKKNIVYLADCQAATMENLPPSTSKSALNRHIAICKIASKMLQGNNSGINFYVPSPNKTIARCNDAANKGEALLNQKQPKPKF